MQIYANVSMTKLFYVCHNSCSLYLAGWWTKFTSTKPKAKEKTDEEAKPEENEKKLPKLELTEDEYEEFHSKYPFPWWCVIIAYVLSILAILW